MIGNESTGSDLGWKLWSVFGKSLDWDHLASDFKLGDEILSLIESLYFEDPEPTS